MSQKKKKTSRIMTILNQGRHIICAVIVFLIVFVYSIDSFAAGTIGSTESLLDYYQILDVTQMPILYKGAFVNYYVAQGYSSSEINWQQNSIKYFFFNNDTAPGSNIYTNARSLMSSTDLATSYTDGVTYDLSNAYTYISAQSVTNNNLRCCLRILSLNSSKICAVFDNNAALYFVSASPFIIYQQVSNTVTNVDTASTNGLYCYPCTSISDMYNSFYCAFTDLDIYYPSSTGNSGFTTFSTTSTDLDLSAENVNFNIFKTGEYIVSPGDPDPVNNPVGYDDAYHYLNFNVANYYSSVPMTKIYHGMDFQWNQNMIEHPDWYAIDTEYVFSYKDDWMNSTVELHVNDSGPISLKNLGLLNGNGGFAPDKYVQGVGFNDFKDGNGNTLTYYINSTITRVTNTSVEYVDKRNFWEEVVTTASNNIIDFINILLGSNIPAWEGLGNGYYHVSNEYGSSIEVMKVTCYTKVSRLTNLSGMLEDNDVDYESGTNVSSYDFLTGTLSVPSNDNATNLYPPEGDLPASVINSSNNLSGGGSGGGVSYGGSNNAYAQGGAGGMVTNIINPEQTPYTMPMDDFGRMKDIFDTVKYSFNQANEQNGFMPVLEETFEMLPSQFWQMLMLGFGVITATATVRFVRNK